MKITPSGGEIQWAAFCFEGLKFPRIVMNVLSAMIMLKEMSQWIRRDSNERRFW